MALFQCEVCGCVENTALASQGFTGWAQKLYDWSYAPERKGMKICSACGPTHYVDGNLSRFGYWHHNFQRDFLPLGEWEMHEGNLRHKGTGATCCHPYYCEPPPGTVIGHVKPWQVFLGNSESQLYTVYAENLPQLLRKVEEKFQWFKGGKWKERPSEDLEGYPTGSVRYYFEVGPDRRGNLYRHPVLIIPERT